MTPFDQIKQMVDEIVYVASVLIQAVAIGIVLTIFYFIFVY